MQLQNQSTTLPAQLKPPRHQPLKHGVRIIPRPHGPQSPEILPPIMPQHILIVARIVHELVLQITPITLRQRLDPRQEPAHGGVRRRVVGGEVVADVEREPRLVGGLQAQGVAAASTAGVHDARGNGLQG